MKAVRFHQHGGADVLRYEEVPEPELQSGDAGAAQRRLEESWQFGKIVLEV